MDLSTATSTQNPLLFCSTAQTWLRWRYSPVAELHTTPDSEAFIRLLGFPSMVHFMRPFFLFTDPVSLRGANEHPLQPTSLHLRLMPQDRVREVDASIRAAFFCKTLSESGGSELARHQSDIFPLLRKMAAQGARDDDLASGEVPLHSLLEAEIAYNAELREAVWKSDRVREIVEKEGGGDEGASSSAAAVSNGGAGAAAAAGAGGGPPAAAILAPRTAPGLAALAPVVSPQDLLHPPGPPSRPASAVATPSASTSSVNTPRGGAGSGAGVNLDNAAEIILRNSYSNWFATFIRDYHSAVRFSHFDPVDFPIAQIFTVTSTHLNQPTHPDCNIVAALNRLIEQSKAHAAAHWPAWSTVSLDRVNLVRIVFIMHDPESDVSDKTVEAVQGRVQAEICGASGGGAYVIRIPGHSKRGVASSHNNTSAAAAVAASSRIFNVTAAATAVAPPHLRPWIHANSLHFMDDYATAVERLQKQLEADNLVTAQMSLEAAIAKVDATHPVVSNIASCANATGATRADYESTARVINTALRLQLLPFVDRRLRAHAQFVSDNKQSALGKFASSLFASNSDKNKQPSVVKDRDNTELRYRADSLEMQMRRAGDLCMALQDYNGALTFYRQARDEWKESLAAREINRPLLGAAKEAIGVCMFLLGRLVLPPNAADIKRDPEAQRFEVARDDFRTAKVQNYTFRVTQLLVQMCREAKTPAHDRGVDAILHSGAQVHAMSPFYQGVMYEQLALFKLVSSPPIAVVPGNTMWLRSYITPELAGSLVCRPRSYAKHMMDAAKRYGDISGLGKHATRCALACWHIIRFRMARSESFPLLVADAALFLAKRGVVENEPITAAGYLAFALHACSPSVMATNSSSGFSRVPHGLQTTMVKVLKDCLQRAVKRHGYLYTNKINLNSSNSSSSIGPSAGADDDASSSPTSPHQQQQQQQHVLIHSTLPLFAYSLIAVVNDGMIQDPVTASHLATQQQQQLQAALSGSITGGSITPSTTTTVMDDFNTECDRLYDDVKEQYTSAASTVHCPRNLAGYRALFSKPHTEKTGAKSLHHQKHHYDDLYLPQPPKNDNNKNKNKKKSSEDEDSAFGGASFGGSKGDDQQLAHFYSTSQDEPLSVRVGLRSRFGCALKKVRLLYVELRPEDRGTNDSANNNNNNTSGEEEEDVKKNNKNTADTSTRGAAAAAADDFHFATNLLVGAGARRVPLQDIEESEMMLGRVVVPGPSATAPAQFCTPHNRSNPNPHLTFLLSDDTSAAVSFTLSCPFRKRGTFAVVGFRYELEVLSMNNKTREQDVTYFSTGDSDDSGRGGGAVLHNVLFPCLHVQHLAHHEGAHTFASGSSAETVAALSAAGDDGNDVAAMVAGGIQRGDLAVQPPLPLHCAMPMHSEEQLMAHAALVFANGIPATHPSYIYVHVRAPVPLVSVEFNPPLPAACRSGELFSTQLIIRNNADPKHRSAAGVVPSADHVRVYISECCGHMFALDAVAGNARKQQQRAELQEKVEQMMMLGSGGTASPAAAAGAGVGKKKMMMMTNKQKQQQQKQKQKQKRKGPKGASDLLAEWTRIPAQDEHSQQNTGGMIRISVPHLEPGVACTFNVLFRAQGNEFLRSSHNSSNSGKRNAIISTPDNDVAAVTLFACWMMPRGYLVSSDPKTAPAISASMLRCARFYRRMLVLPSISVAPKCVPLISTKPLRAVPSSSSSSSSFHPLAPQIALSIEIRSEKKATRSLGSSAAAGAVYSPVVAPGSKADTFFVIDDISIISTGWKIKNLAASSQSCAAGAAADKKKTTKKDPRALLVSRSVTTTTNWSCAALLTRKQDEQDDGRDVVVTEEEQQQQQTASSSSSCTAPPLSMRWSSTTLVPRINVPPLDTSSDSSDDDNSSSSSSSSSDSDDDDDHMDSRPTFSRRRPLLPSKQALLHFAVNAPIAGAGVFGRPPILAEGLAFFLDSSEKQPQPKEQQGSPTSPSPKSLDASALPGGALPGSLGDAFPSTDDPADPFEKELLALPDEFSTQEKLPVLLKVSWREIGWSSSTAATTSSGFDEANSSSSNNNSVAFPSHQQQQQQQQQIVLRRGITFEMVHIAPTPGSSGQTSNSSERATTTRSSADMLYEFRERLRCETKYRRENQGRPSPPHSPASPTMRADQNNVRKIAAAAAGVALPSNMSGADIARLVPRVLCALSAPHTRVCSTFSQSGFAAEVPVNVSVANLSQFPVLVSVYATPRYTAGGSSSAGGMPVIFSGRHAYTDVLVQPAATVSNLQFVALAMSPGILDVSSSCFSFEVVNALICASTRSASNNIIMSSSSSMSNNKSQVKYFASSTHRTIVGSLQPAPFPVVSPPRQAASAAAASASSSASSQQQQQQQELPAPQIVFGPIGGIAHSSLVRVEAARAVLATAPQPQQQQPQASVATPASSNTAGRSLLDLSFSSRAVTDAAEAAISNKKRSSIVATHDDMPATSPASHDRITEQQQQQQPSATPLLRRRGERGASRVVRTADGSAFVPLRVLLPENTSPVSNINNNNNSSTGDFAQSSTPVMADVSASSSQSVAFMMDQQQQQRQPQQHPDPDKSRNNSTSAPPTTTDLSPKEQALVVADDNMAPTTERGDDDSSEVRTAPTAADMMVRQEENGDREIRQDPEDSSEQQQQQREELQLSQQQQQQQQLDPPQTASQATAAPTSSAACAAVAAASVHYDPSPLDLIAARVVAPAPGRVKPPAPAPASPLSSTSSSSSPGTRVLPGFQLQQQASAAEPPKPNTHSPTTRTATTNNLFESSDSDDEAAQLRKKKELERPRLNADLLDDKTSKGGDKSPASAGFKRNRFGTSSDDDDDDDDRNNHKK